VNIFERERVAIKTIRDVYPNEPQMTLAKRIKLLDIGAGGSPVRHAVNICWTRPLLSIYSVIRRYDKRKAA